MKQYEKSILPRFVFLLFTFSSSRSNSTVWYSTVEEVPFKTQEILFWMGLTIVLEDILWKSMFRTQHINTCGFKEQGFLFKIFQIFFKKTVMVWQPDTEWLERVILCLHMTRIKMQRTSGCPSRALLFSTLMTEYTFASKLSKLVTGPPVIILVILGSCNISSRQKTSKAEKFLINSSSSPSTMSKEPSPFPSASSSLQPPSLFQPDNPSSAGTLWFLSFTPVPLHIQATIQRRNADERSALSALVISTSVFTLCNHTLEIHSLG